MPVKNLENAEIILARKRIFIFQKKCAVLCTWPADTPDVVLTEKDAVKLAPARAGATRVWVAALDFALPAAFETALLSLLPAPPQPLPRPDHGNQTA